MPTIVCCLSRMLNLVLHTLVSNNGEKRYTHKIWKQRKKNPKR